MTLTLDEVVDLMLEGSAMTEPCTGSYYKPVQREACAVGAAAYAYTVKYLNKNPDNATLFEDAVVNILQVFRDNNITSGDVFATNDHQSRDAAIAFVKDRL